MNPPSDIAGRALTRKLLATAIIDAVDDHGWPNSFGIVELAAYHRAPRIHYSAPELLRRLPDLVCEILRQLYERSGDVVLLDAHERPDPAAITYRRRVSTVAAHVKVTQWPPCLPVLSRAQGLATGAHHAT